MTPDHDCRSQCPASRSTCAILPRIRNTFVPSSHPKLERCLTVARTGSDRRQRTLQFANGLRGRRRLHRFVGSSAWGFG